MKNNLDEETVNSLGDEWSRFDQSELPESEASKRFDEYFAVSPRDRFGTPLEHRFTREDIAALLERAGLEKVRFSDLAPYWCAVGYKVKV